MRPKQGHEDDTNRADNQTVYNMRGKHRSPWWCTMTLNLRHCGIWRRSLQCHRRGPGRADNTDHLQNQTTPDMDVIMDIVHTMCVHLLDKDFTPTPTSKWKITPKVMGNDDMMTTCDKSTLPKGYLQTRCQASVSVCTDMKAGLTQQQPAVAVPVK